MKDFSKDFSSFDGKIWLNCASEGAIPLAAAQAAREAIEWKLKPYLLTHRRFAEIPEKLKSSIGRLMHVAVDDVILGNSATYGIHLLANGLPLKKGDEVILMQNDFPTDILPWLRLCQRGVIVRQVKPRKHVLTLEEVKTAVTAATRVLCLPHVHTFTGYALDIEAIGNFCRQRKIIFIVNFSQSLGTRPIDVAQLPVDGMTTAGFKWLLGPYGTGFCWMRPQVREQLEYYQEFWVNTAQRSELEAEGDLTLSSGHDAKRYDVFGTANFFNFCPLTASIDYLLSVGLANVHAHNELLVEKIIEGLQRLGYKLISPVSGPERSNLVVFTHPQKDKNASIFQRLIAQGVYLASWKGNLRAAPHVFNTADDIARFLAVIGPAAA